MVSCVLKKPTKEEIHEVATLEPIQQGFRTVAFGLLDVMVAISKVCLMWPVGSLITSFGYQLGPQHVGDIGTTTPLQSFQYSPPHACNNPWQSLQMVGKFVDLPKSVPSKICHSLRH